MSEAKSSKQKLPPKTNDKVVEVSLKQVIWGFSLLLVSTAAVASTVIVLKDYSKYKRQEAIINSVVRIIDIVNVQKGENHWKQEKKGSSSHTKTSLAQQESPDTLD